MFDALANYWNLWLQSHIGFVSLLLGLLSLLATLFKPSLWRRIVFTAAIGCAGLLYSLYEPVARIAVIARSLIFASACVGAFWWIIGLYENWRSRKQPIPMQPSGTFETVADTLLQVVADSKSAGFEAALTSQGNTLIVKKTVPEKKK